MSPVWISNVSTSQFRKVHMSLSEFRPKATDIDIDKFFCCDRTCRFLFFVLGPLCESWDRFLFFSLNFPEGFRLYLVMSDISCAGNTRDYYSTNCNTIQIWSWCSRYLSSVGNVYPAIYVASYVGRKSEVKKCRQKDLKMLRVLLSICWIIKQLSCSISRNIVWF